MRISARSDYAVRAMVYIARRTNAGPVPAEEIAHDQQIPRQFLLVVLAELRRAGLLVSVRGQAGGWQLAGPASEISVADTVRAVDGPLASVQGQRPEALGYPEPMAPVQVVWIALRTSVREVLEGVTVADLASGQLPDRIVTRSNEPGAWQRR